MLKLYDSKGQEINVSTLEDLNGKVNEKSKSVNTLPTSFNDASFFFDVDKSFSIQGVEIPNYSRGVFVNNGRSNDSVAIVVTPNKKLILCFRNNGNWTVPRII